MAGGLQARDSRYSKPRVPDVEKWSPVMRGFPEMMEVLTDVGWLSWESLFRAGRYGTKSSKVPLFGDEIDFSSTLIPVSDGYRDKFTPFQQGHHFTKVNEIDYTRWSVGDDFPRLATLSPEALQYSHKGNVRVVFQRPVEAFRFLYENHQLVHFKKRGLDMVVPRFTDVFAKPKFGNVWGFTVADDFCVTRKVQSAFRSVVNRYSPDASLYGDVDVDRMLELSSVGELFALTDGYGPARVYDANKDASRKRIWDALPYAAVLDETSGRLVAPSVERTSVECCNVVFRKGASHTLIVRRPRKEKGGARKGEWVGEPVVMGDGYDKSQLRIDKLEGFYA